jgi:HEAT repeat protein
MPSDPSSLDAPDARARARAAAALGHAGRWPRGTSEALTELVAHDPAAAVRAAALSAIVRRAHPARALTTWLVAARDEDANVRRVAAESASKLAPRLNDVGAVVATLVEHLDDRAPLVAEAAAFSLGELGAPIAVDALARHAGGHADPLVREACVAALGSLAGAGALDDRDAVLPVLLAATDDKPAIRRRAVIALSAFDGPEVDVALERALSDRDWQVRQLAEDLTSEA